MVRAHPPTHRQHLRDLAPPSALPQNPGAASVALFSKNEVGVVYTLVWWAHGYLPGGLLRRAYAGLPPLRCAAQLCRAVLRATTVVQRVNAAATLHPGVAAAPLMLGTLGGAGGKLLTDAFLYCAGYRQGELGAARGAGDPGQRSAGANCGQDLSGRLGSIPATPLLLSAHVWGA